jgi:hypothetical protein
VVVFSRRVAEVVFGSTESLDDDVTKRGAGCSVLVGVLDLGMGRGDIEVRDCEIDQLGNVVVSCEEVELDQRDGGGPAVVVHEGIVVVILEPDSEEVERLDVVVCDIEHLKLIPKNNHLGELRGVSLEQLFRDVVLFLSRWFNDSDSDDIDELARKCQCLKILGKGWKRAYISLGMRGSAIVDVLGEVVDST